jgi:hypothetical protein
MSFLNHDTSAIGCNLHSNDLFVERISINPIDALKNSFDLVIGRKYRIAKEPEWGVVYRTTVDIEQLKRLQAVFDQLLIWEV